MYEKVELLIILFIVFYDKKYDNILFKKINMPFIPLFKGVKFTHRRSYFPDDELHVITDLGNEDRENKETSNLSTYEHRYNGIITDTQVGTESATYVIDGIVRVNTINPGTQQTITAKLENEYNQTKIATGLSALSVCGGFFLNGVFGLQIPSLCLVGTGSVGTLVGAYRIYDYRNELSKWSKTIKDHCNIRKLIPKLGYKKIHDDKLVGKYMTFNEANAIWMRSINDYKKDTYNVRSTNKLSHIEEFRVNHPLKRDYVLYFAYSKDYNSFLEYSGRLDDVKSSLDSYDSKFSVNANNLEYEREQKIKISTAPYKMAQTVLNTVHTADTVNDAVTDLNESADARRKNRPIREVNGLVKDAVYITGQSVMEDMKKKTTKNIEDEYKDKIYELKTQRTVEFVGLFPLIYGIYNDFCERYIPSKL